MMRITKHLVTIVVMLATVITITFPVSTPAQGTSLESYRNADLGYAIDYPSDWEASDSFGILEIDSPKESLVATLQVISLADDTGLGEFSNGRVQNVEAETRDVDVDVAVYEDTEFGGNDARGIKYKMNGNTVYTIWTIEDDKAYVLTIIIKNSDMKSTLLNQANQIKDSFRLLNTDRITSVNSESNDDDDDNNNNDNGNGRDIVIEEETLFEIDNIINNPVTSTDTDSNTDTDTDTDSDIVTDLDTNTDADTDSDTDKNVDCVGRQDFVNALGVCKDTEQVDDYDTEETADNEPISREIPMINSANGIELDEEETETEESPDNGNNNNDNGKHNDKHNGKNNGNDGAD
jgi:hypothetical protein